MPNLSSDQQPSRAIETKEANTVLGPCEAIAQWVKELAESLQREQLTQHDWRMLGRAMMIAHPEPTDHLVFIRKVAAQTGVNLIELSADDFVTWVTEGYVPVEHLPALVYVPQGAWSEKYKSDERPEAISHFRAALPSYLAKFGPQQWLIFVTMGSSYANLDPELRTIGLFDRRFDVPEPKQEELGLSFLNVVGQDLCDDSLLAHQSKVGRVIEDKFDEKRRYGLIALAMQRLAHREQRKLNFDDLVNFSVHGGGEGTYPQETDPEKLRRYAIHETGHAIIAILDSDGKNIPDYVGLVSSESFCGIVTESFAFNQSRTDAFSFKDSRHKIRISLAGRAAEAFFLGPDDVSSMGARSDLVTASNIAKDLVGRLGFSADHNNDNPDALNLLVFDDEPSLSETAHIEQEARRLLAKQYTVVTNLIRENQPLFQAIQDILLQKRVLTQTDLHLLLTLSDFRKGHA